MKNRIMAAGALSVAALFTVAGCSEPVDGPTEPQEPSQVQSSPIEPAEPSAEPTEPRETTSPEDDWSGIMPPAPEPPTEGAYTFGTVVDVLEADTFLVDTPEGTLTVRAIGIDAPGSPIDSLEPLECYEMEALFDAAFLLYPGHQVQLEFSDSVGRIDDSGRTLAYVLMEDGQDFGNTMIALGSAEAEFPTSHPREALYENTEDSAQEFFYGMWGVC